MTTFLIMQTRITDEIVRDDLASQIKNAINTAITTWEGIRFSFNEATYLQTTAHGIEFYPFGGGGSLTYRDGTTALGTGETMLEIDSITATVNNTFYPLTPRTKQWFDRNSAPASQYMGQPDSYAVYADGTLRLFPVPDATYSLTIYGMRRLPPSPLTLDTDTNSWMTEGEALIRQQAKYIIYRDVVRDPDGKALASEGIQEAQWQLERKMAARAYTGSQRAWSL